MFRNLATTPARTLRIIHARQSLDPSARYVGSKTKTDTDDKHAVDKANEGESSNIQEANAKAGIE
jgi:hypothetical protein